jgi:hypothetical protein
MQFSIYCYLFGWFGVYFGFICYQVEEDEMGGTCNTNRGEEERV